MIDWRSICCSKDMGLEGEAIKVSFHGGRKHYVRTEEIDGELRIWSVIARRSVVEGQKNLQIRIWQRNHAARLVSYRIDERGRLIGEAWAPKAGLTQDELEFYIRSVAAECDRLEYLMTGSDMD